MTSTLHPPSFDNHRYSTISALGDGGMAQVFRVLDTKYNVERAIKILQTTDETSKKRLQQEAHVLVSLSQYNNIVTVYEVFEENDNIGLVMEKCSGNLVDWVQAEGVMPLTLAVEVIMQVLQGLSKAHEHGIVHRDIKPHNILITVDGGIKLADFGLALQLYSPLSLTKTNTLLGSIPYMAPEQRTVHLSNSVGFQTDLYSVAKTFLYILCGDTFGDLYTTSTLEVLSQHLPPDILEIIQKAGKEKPADRFASAQEMHDAFALLLRDLPQHQKRLVGVYSVEYPIQKGTGTPPSTHVSSVSQSIEAKLDQHLRGLYVVVGGFALLLVVLGIGAWVFFSEYQPNTETQSQTATISDFASFPKCEDFAVEGSQFRFLGPRETVAGTLFDADQDGYTDAFFTNQQDQSLSIYWGDADFNFHKSEEIPFPRSEHPALFGDFNQDGLLDLVSMHTDLSQIQIRYAIGARSWKEAQIEGQEILFQSPIPKRAGLTDVDKDGLLDVVFQYPLKTVAVRKQENFSVGLHAEVEDIDGSIVVGRWEPSIYWNDDSHIYKKTFATNGSLSSVQKILEVTNVKQLFLWFDNKEKEDKLFASDGHSVLDVEGACVTLVMDGHTQAGILSVGYWNDDPFLDLLLARTCASCTSNHLLLLGASP